MRPGMRRVSDSLQAKNPACGPPYPNGTPKRWLVPTAMSALISPGGRSIVRAKRSVAATASVWNNRWRHFTSNFYTLKLLNWELYLRHSYGQFLLISWSSWYFLQYLDIGTTLRKRHDSKNQNYSDLLRPLPFPLSLPEFEQQKHSGDELYPKCKIFSACSACVVSHFYENEN